ncbi:MAG: hypothetical protein DI529_02465 [Chryseobacterium sp.]|nr:MAG: hypothetical protein DI529_02465 [Chryseobacterium sp.]
MLPTILPLLEQGRQEWNDNIKMLLYKNNEDIFDHIDFEDESIYSNPFINLYFSNNDNITKDPDLIETILYADWTGNKKIVTSNFEKTYIRNIGWIDNHKYNRRNDIETITEHPTIIEDTNIELLVYKDKLLDQCFGEYEYEISKISKENIHHLTRAYQLIKKNLPEYFVLIDKYCPKCIVFDTLPYNTNSFAYKKALGISFYNAYQENYDEVFFVDDIAHQTGHVLMYTMLFDKKLFFLIDDENTTIQSLAMPYKTEQNRSVEIWFHALYTYYASFICLDASLENNDFSEIQRLEALGRILLYIQRCHYDLQLFYTSIPVSELFNRIPRDISFVNNRSKDIFTEIGLEIFYKIKDKWIEIYNKYYPIVENFNMENQTYNFNFSTFLKNNPQCLEV